MTQQPPPRTLPRAIRAFTEFFRLEAASGIVLMVATVVALVWANSGASAAYQELFHLPLTLQLGAKTLHFHPTKAYSRGDPYSGPSKENSDCRLAWLDPRFKSSLK